MSKSNATLNQCRKAFEEWANMPERADWFCKDEWGEYIKPFIAMNWRAWKAAWEAKNEEAELKIIDERDAAEDALGEAYCLVMSHHPEWSNLFGYKEALEEIEQALSPKKEITAEEKDKRIALLEDASNRAHKLFTAEIEIMQKQIRDLQSLLYRNHLLISSKLSYYRDTQLDLDTQKALEPSRGDGR